MMRITEEPIVPDRMNCARCFGLTQRITDVPKLRCSKCDDQVPCQAWQDKTQVQRLRHAGVL